MLSFLNKNVIVFDGTVTICCKFTDTADGLCKSGAARVLVSPSDWLALRWVGRCGKEHFLFRI
jgi:hypothetical protein